MSIRRCLLIVLGALWALSSNASAQTAGIEILDAAGRPASFVLEGAKMRVQVVDASASSGTLDIELQADLSGDHEFLRLQRTSAPASGTYEGTIDTSRGPGLPGNGRLETTADGPPYRFDTVRVTYVQGAQSYTDSVPTAGSATSFRDEAGGEAASYAAGETVRLRVEDHNFDDPSRFDSVTATLQSLVTGDSAQLQLQEVARSGGIFEAALPTERDAPASPADGRLQVSPGEAIEAMHVDANGLLASGARADVTATGISFRDEAGRPTALVVENGRARLRVFSIDPSQDRFSPDTLTLALETLYSQDREDLTLTETGADTHVFEGSIGLSFNPGLPGNGSLETLGSGQPDFLGDEITARRGPEHATARTIGSRVVFLDSFGRETAAIPLGAPVRVRVTDFTRNSPGSRDSFSIMLQGCFDFEYLNVEETGFDTGVFEGRIQSVGFPSNSSPDGTFNAQPGCEVVAANQGQNSPNPVEGRARFTQGELSFVDAQGNLAIDYLEGTRAYLRAVMHGFNFNPGVRETFQADVRSDLSGDGEAVQLQETGADTGVFEGSVALRFGAPPLPGNGALETAEDFGPPHQFDTLLGTVFLSPDEVLTASASTINARLWFVDAFGSVTATYPQGSRVYLRVEEAISNQDPTRFDSSFVTVRSGTGDEEHLVLAETGKDTGVFEGFVDLDGTGSPSLGDNRLQAGPGTEITLERGSYTAEPARATVAFASVAFVDEGGRPTVQVLENGTARVRVFSTDHNQNHFGADTTTVAIETRYSHDREDLVLTETGADTNVFEGSIRLSFNPGLAGNGSLETLGSGYPEYLGEEITARFGPNAATARTIGSRVVFLDAFGRETAAIPLGAPVRVRVTDFTHNSPGSRDSFSVMLQGCFDFEYLNVEETGFDTGVFEGQIQSVGFPSNSSPDGVFNARPGCEVVASNQGQNSPNPVEGRARFTQGELSFVDAQGNLAIAYLEGTRAYLRAVAKGLNSNPGVREAVQADVRSELSGDGEAVQLQETGADTGVFEGSVALRFGAPPLPGNGTLETAQDFGPPHQFDTLRASLFLSPDEVLTASVSTINARLWFVDAFGAVTATYPQGSRVYLRVEEPTSNQDPTRFDVTFVTVRSGTGDEEHLVLAETGKDTGVFEGFVDLDSTGSPTPGDNRLQAGPGTEITLERGGYTAEPARATIDFAGVGFVDEAGRPTVQVLENGTARVRVFSTDRNQNHFGADTATVALETRYSHDREDLELTETGADTNVFEGSIRLSFNPGLAGNGSLETLGSGYPEYLGEEITARFGPNAATARTIGSRVVFLDAFGRETAAMPLGALVRVRVTDFTRNSPGSRDSFSVMLQGCFDVEYLSLTETGFDTGVFEGQIQSVGFPSNSSPDGVFNAQPGCEVVASNQGQNSPNPVEARARFTQGELSFVDAQGNLAISYLEGTRAYLRAVMHGLNFNPGVRETLAADVRSELSGDGEAVQLQETGADTGVFEGSVALSYGAPPLPGNGTLETAQDFGPPHQFDTLRASLFLSPDEVLTASASTINARLWFVDAFGAVTATYPQGSRVYLRVAEATSNQDPTRFDLTFVTVRSGTGDEEHLVLAETGKNTGVFEGFIDLDGTGSPTPGDNLLQAGPGTEITLERGSYTAEPARATIDFAGVGFVDEAGRPTVQVLENGTARVRVFSTDHNQNHFGADTATVAIETRYSHDREDLTLTETGADTSVFEGSIGLSFNPGLPGNGFLETLGSGFPEYLGDEIAARFGPYTATARTIGSRVTFLDAFGRETAAIPLGSQVRVRVTDFLRNDPLARDSFSVMLQGCFDVEYLNVVETGFSTGVFEGRIQSVGFPSNSSPDGVFNAQPGCEVVASNQGQNSPNPVEARARFTQGELSFVDAQGNLAIDYLEGTRAYLRAAVSGLNSNPGVRETFQADVRSELSGDGEQVQLQETGPDTGVFEGSVALRYGAPPLPGNGTVETAEDFGPPHQFDTLRASLFLSPDEVFTASASTVNTRLWFVDAFGAVTATYPQGSRVYLRVAEATSNQDPAGFDSAFVTVRSGTGDEEHLVLAETGEDTGVFEGFVDLDSAGSPTPGDNRLQAGPSTQITLERGGGFTAEPARATIDFASVGFVDEAGQPAVEVLENGTARVRVFSTDHNPNPTIPDSTTVALETRYSHDREDVALTETGANTSVFEGSIPLWFSPGTQGNGRLETLGSGHPEYLGEEITARFGPYQATVRTVGSRVSFIDSSGRPTSTIPLGGPVRVRVIDYQRNDVQNLDSFSVILQGCFDYENLTLVETGLSTGVFEGAIQSVPFPSTSSPDGVLNAQLGCELMVQHQNVQSPNPTEARATFTVSTNQPPVANDDTATVDRNGTVTIVILANDSDPDGDRLVIDSLTQPAHGTLDGNADGSLIYRPAANFAGTDSFTYTLADEKGATDTATVTITVIAVNRPPVAADDAATVAEDGTVTIVILANDSDPDGGPLVIESLTQPSHGTLDGNADGSLIYHPAANFYGTDSFTYTLADDKGKRRTGDRDDHVNPVNDLPVAVADSATTGRGRPASLSGARQRHGRGRRHPGRDRGHARGARHGFDRSRAGR